MVRTEYREDTDEDEWNQGQQSPPFTGAPDGDGADRRTEDQLKLREQDLWDRADWVRQDADVECLAESAKNAVGIAIGKRVSDHPPLNGTHGDRQ